MKPLIINPGLVYIDCDFQENLSVHILEGNIQAITPRTLFDSNGEYEVHDYPNNILVPGFIDIQVNGGADILFNQRIDIAAIEQVIEAHRRYGTTGLVVTLISDTLQKTHSAIEHVAHAIEKGVKGLLGIHLEGPFLNPQFKGTHDPRYLIRPTLEILKTIKPLSQGVNVMTIAPELFTEEHIKILASQGYIVLAGHSAATYQDLQQKAPIGIKGATHLFNAMLASKGREPGIAGYALTHDDFYSTVIFDGIHCHPAMIKTLFKTKAHQGIISITDAMALVGSQQKHFYLYDKRITCKAGALYDENGILSGSHVGMSDMLQFLQTLDFSLAELIPLFTENPARLLGIDHYVGKIAVGYQADLTLLDDCCHVVNTYVQGNPLEHAQENTLK